MTKHSQHTTPPPKHQLHTLHILYLHFTAYDHISANLHPTSGEKESSFGRDVLQSAPFKIINTFQIAQGTANQNLIQYCSTSKITGIQICQCQVGQVKK